MSALNTTTTAQVLSFPTPSATSQLEMKLARYMELKALNTEFNKLKKELGELFQGEADIQIGAYHITGQSVSRKGYEVQPFTYWDWKAR